jgi:hypothetical protein
MLSHHPGKVVPKSSSKKEKEPNPSPLREYLHPLVQQILEL